MFRDCRLARMSDGHYCFVRDLGPVKGGKGMRHHEVIVDFTPRGVLKWLKGRLARFHRSRQPDDLPPYRLGVRESLLTWRQKRNPVAENSGCATRAQPQTSF